MQLLHRLRGGLRRAFALAGTALGVALLMIALTLALVVFLAVILVVALKLAFLAFVAAVTMGVLTLPPVGSTRPRLASSTPARAASVWWRRR